MSGFAQAPAYSLVELTVDRVAFNQLNAAGLFPDEAHWEGNLCEAIYRPDEVDAIRTMGIPVRVLAADAERFYAERAQKDLADLHLAKTAGAPAGFQLGSMGGFLTYAEMLLEMDSLVMDHPNFITGPDTIGFSFENRPILLWKISDNPANDEAEPEVLYTGLHHAREPMSMVNLIYYMQYILEENGTDPEATYLINNREMYFVPCINPDGYLFNQQNNPTGGGLWRKNRRPTVNGNIGVDLNRNYDYEFGFNNQGSSPDPNSDLYRGPSGFSEPETQAIRDLCNSRDFKTAFNYHSFGNLLIYPWGFDSNAPLPDFARFVTFGNILTEQNLYNAGNPVQTVGYNANGVSDDWMYGEQLSKDKIFSMTPEIGAGNDGFWPQPSRIEPLAEENLQANLRLAWLAGDYVQTEPEAIGFSSGPVVPVPTEFLNAGLDTTGIFTAEFVTSDPAILSVNGPFTFNQLAPNAAILDTFELNVDPNTAIGTEICGVIRTTMSGTLVEVDTVCFRFGAPVVVFSDTVPASPFAWSGGWAITSEKAYSGMYSITDSPQSDYPSGTNNELFLSQPINLSNFTLPTLRFRATWDIEDNWDYCQVAVSMNGGPYMPVGGANANPGTGSFQPTGEPVYDGVEVNWVLEEIDLAAFAGNTLSIRFAMVSDNFVEFDGFYFDDLEVLAFPTEPVGIEEIQLDKWFLYPNPGREQFRIHGVGNAESTFQLLDLAGRQLHAETVQVGEVLTLDGLAPGLYLYQFGDAPVRKLVVR